MPPFRNLCGKYFSFYSQKPQNIMASILILLKVLMANMTFKKIWAYSKPHNFKFLTNKMNQKADFAIMLRRYERT